MPKRFMQQRAAASRCSQSKPRTNFTRPCRLTFPSKRAPRLRKGIGLMVEDVGTLVEIIAARDDPSVFGRTIRDLIDGCLERWRR